MTFASLDYLGSPLGALLGLLRGLLGRPGATLGVLERSWVVLEDSWARLWALLARLGAIRPLEKSREAARERAETPGKFGNLGPQPLEY